jgi:hypothetical protein
MSDTDNLVVPSPEGTLVGLLMLTLADPAGCLERAQKLQAAAAEARDAREALAREQAGMAVARVEHEHALANATSRHQQECEARRRELRAQESDLAERERAVDEKSQRAEATMRAVEMRAADLSNRLHGHAA